MTRLHTAPSRSEGIRRNRLGDIRRLLRDRWGHELPDDDAGYSDLKDLLYPISLGPDAEKRMRKEIELVAPGCCALRFDPSHFGHATSAAKAEGERAWHEDAGH